MSCNTTSTIRVLGALADADLLARARGVSIRRATDQWEFHLGGVMNTVVPEAAIPSHQGPDAQTVRPDLDVVTIAAKAAHTQTHNHYWTLQLTRVTSRDEILDALRAAPRIAFIPMADGLVALNTVELMKDLGRPRGDMWEVAIWEDVVTVDGDEAYLTYQVYNEAICRPRICRRHPRPHRDGDRSGRVDRHHRPGAWHAPRLPHRPLVSRMRPTAKGRGPRRHAAGQPPTWHGQRRGGTEGAQRFDRACANPAAESRSGPGADR